MAAVTREEKICPKCKNDIYAGAKHCPICGEPVSADWMAAELKKQDAGSPAPAGNGWAGFLRTFVWCEIILGIICCIALGAIINFWVTVIGVLVILLSTATIMVVIDIADDLRKSRFYLSEINRKIQ